MKTTVISSRDPLTPDMSQIVAAHDLVRDLLVPRAALYWMDLLFHVMLGWTAVWVLVYLPPGILGMGLLYLVAVLSLYRAMIFIHELAHHRPDDRSGFRLGWNLLCGIPVLVPSFTYSGVHQDHHLPSVYSTPGDGEYQSFGWMTPWTLIGYLAVGVLVPLVVILRFVMLTPFAWVSPFMRRWTLERASSLAVDFEYRRGPPKLVDRYWRWQEFGAWLWGTSFLGLMVAGVIPWSLGIALYAVMVGIFILNNVRTLTAHRYRQTGERTLSLMEQFHDSVDIPGHRLLTPLWGPVGLRYHATHHLFPGMPYHNLGRAYRRLIAELDDNLWYLQSTLPGVRAALLSLWRDARDHAKNNRND